jgi:very-short-patch-repair endonuclease
MSYKAKFIYDPDLKQRARALRRQGTLGEVLLWKKLQKRQLHNLRFLRQRPIETYIVDFFCPELQLVIEIDGVSHVEKEVYDQKRQQHLEAQGLTVLRIQERDVRNNIDGVVELIKKTAAELMGKDSSADKG